MYKKRKPFTDLNEAARWFQDYLQRPDRYGPSCVGKTRLTESVYRRLQADYPPDPGLSDAALALSEAFALLYADSSRIPPIEELQSADALQRLPFALSLVMHPAYPGLKRQCAGKELPAYFAAVAFTRGIEQEGPAMDHMKQLLKILRLLREQIFRLIAYTQAEKRAEKQWQLMIRLYKKAGQAEDVRRKIQREILTALSSVSVDEAMERAGEAAETVQAALDTWGSGKGEDTPLNRDVIQQARRAPALLKIAGLLGKYREMLLQKRASGYRFGSGEKYDVSLGGDLSACLPSELAALAIEETQPLFWDKYSRRQLTQFRRRSKVTKGEGDIIVALDESGSMEEHNVWAKALFLALLDIAAEQRRRLALIHFGSEDEIRIDRFLPGKYTRQDKLDAARHFFDGGTDFVRPLREAMRLLTDGGFEKADVLFITDGICTVPRGFAEDFQAFKKRYRVTLTGILLDLPESCSPSFQSLCDKVYQSPQTDADKIAVDILSGKCM